MYFKKLMNLTANIVLYNHFTNVYRSLKGFLKMVIDHEVLATFYNKLSGLH